MQTQHTRQRLFSFSLIVATFIHGSAYGYERILCQSDPYKALHILTFPSYAVESYKPPGLYLKNDRGQNIQDLTGLQIETSSPMNLSYYIESQTTSTDLFKVQTNIPQGKSQLTPIASWASLSSQISSIYSQLNLPLSSYSYLVEKKDLIYPSGEQRGGLRYLLINTESHKSLELQLPGNYTAATHPAFSPQGTFIKFEAFDEPVQKMRGLIYDRQNQIFLKIPNPLNENADQIQIHFLSESLISWIEVQPRQKGLLQYSVRLSSISSASSEPSATILISDSSTNLSPYLVTLLAPQKLLLARSSEVFETPSDLNDEGSIQRHLKQGTLNLTEFNVTEKKTLLITKISEKNLNYPPQLYKITEDYFTFGPLLNSIQLIKSDHQLLFSLGAYGGLSTLDLNSEKWSFIATLYGSFYKCFHPQLLFEKDTP